MSVESIIKDLNRKSGELNSSFPLVWKYPPAPPQKPLEAAPDNTWTSWNDKRMTFQKNAKNWLYADLCFPEKKDGIPLAGTHADVFIHGWAPFTLWIDGVEMFKEEHAWLATGPIAAPVGLIIKPGENHRMILCVEPTELAAGFTPFNLVVESRVCGQTALQLEAAAAQLEFAGAIAATDKDRKLVEKAALALDAAALEINDWMAVEASTRKMERVLTPLSRRAKAHTVHLLAHSHIDMDWLWTWKDTVHCMRRDFKAVVDVMDDHPEVTFAISQIPSYDVVRQADPGVFDRMKARIAEGRWQNAAGTWVEGDLHMADGESIARHMLYAADWTKEHLNSKAKVLWEPDTFGHPGNMPQLAKLGELDFYFQMRCNPGGHDNWPARIWEGVDGSRITAFTCGYGGNGIPPGRVVSTAAEAWKFGLKDSLIVWGHGDHGGAMARYMLQRLETFRDKPLIPTVKFSAIPGLAAALRKAKAKLPVNKGETFSLFEGCWTTHAALKMYNRKCEGALLTAEALAALAALDRRNLLKNAWTPVLFNQFHDLLDGSAVHDSYLDTCRRAEDSLEAAGNVTREAVAVMARIADDGRTLALFNQLGFERTEPVRLSLPPDTTHLVDDAGNIVPVQKIDGQFIFVVNRIGAFGKKNYTIATSGLPDRQFAPVSISEKKDYGEQGDYFRVETAHGISRLSKSSGTIGSYYDKTLKREFIAYGVPKYLSHTPVSRLDLGMNVFQVIDESHGGMSAWLIHNVRREENLLSGAEVSLVETGPVFARFKVVHKFRSSKIEEDVIYYNHFQRVDFKAVIDWREKGNAEVGVPQLKVAFTGGMTKVRARFEGPFCVAERPANGQEQPTQKWVDASGEPFGFTLYNDSKYGCDVLGSRIRMTLLRNAYEPDPESDNGIHTVEFAFAPHGPGISAAELTRNGMAFNRKLVSAIASDKAEKSRPGLQHSGSESVVCTCLRMAEHSNRTLIRFFETCGEKARIRFKLGKGVRSAEEVNFLENPTGEKCRIAGGTVTAAFRPYEVKTFLIDPMK